MLASKNYVLIIGSSNIDLNIYSERLPRKGETITGGQFAQSFGGKGANQSVASVRSGSTTSFIGKIGIDDFGDKMISHLRKEGVNINSIIRDKKKSSGVAFIMIDRNGENMISVAPGANANLTPEDIQKRSSLIKSAMVILVQMEIPIKTIKEIYNIASKGKPLKILNPAPLKAIPVDILKKIDIIVPNEGELIHLNSLMGFEKPSEKGKNTIKQISRNITSLGVKNVITTLGSKGTLVYQSEKNRSLKIPAYKVQAIDTVGAGDCFNGVLASRLNQGKDLVTSVKYATAAASIAVTRKGAQESMPYLHEIEKRYKKYIKLF